MDHELRTTKADGTEIKPVTLDDGKAAIAAAKDDDDVHAAQLIRADSGEVVAEYPSQ